MGQSKEQDKTHIHTAETRSRGVAMKKGVSAGGTKDARRLTGGEQGDSMEAEALFDERKEINVLKENGEMEIPDLSKSKQTHLTNKAAQIMKLTGASQFLLKDKKIIVPGGYALNHSVAKYVNIILNQLVPDDYAEKDFLRILVSQGFAERFAQGVADIEHAKGVLIVIERLCDTERSVINPGEVVEVEARGVWSMATILVAVANSVTVRYSRDQRQEEVSPSRIRCARSIAIFGPQSNRLAAALQIIAAFEEDSSAALGALHDNPYLNGHRLGVVSQELPVKREVVSRLEKSPFLKQVMLATGCSIRFFMKPAAATSAWKKRRSIPCVLVAGSLEQRWRGLQGIKIIALGMEEKRHPSLPPSLLGDARQVTIPKDMLSVVIGKQMESMLQLMQATNTVFWWQTANLWPFTRLFPP